MQGLPLPFSLNIKPDFKCWILILALFDFLQCRVKPCIYFDRLLKWKNLLCNNNSKKKPEDIIFRLLILIYIFF